MKKILVFGLSEYFGGIESYFLNMISHCYNEFIFDFIPENKDIAKCEEFKKYNCKIYKDIVNWRRNLIKYTSQICTILKENKYDGIYMNSLSAFNIIPILIAYKMKINVRIMHSHNSAQPKNVIKMLIHKINKKIISKYITNRFACSASAAEWMFNPNEKYIILPNAIDTDKFKFNIDIRNDMRRKYNIDDETILLGFVGRLAYQKNPLFLVDIMLELLLLKKKVKLFIVGDGNLKEKLLSKINSSNLQEHIFLLGSMDNINELMNAFDLLLLPSKFEGLGIVLIEAQFSGLKCLVSKQIPNEANISNTLEYIEIEKEKEWAQKIIKYTNNIIERENIVKKCNPKYSLTYAANEFKGVLKDSFNTKN